jgi:hypothetical protein
VLVENISPDLFQELVDPHLVQTVFERLRVRLQDLRIREREVL